MKKLYRSTTDRKIAGICGGLALTFARASSRASMTVLPVTEIVSGNTPSFRRFSRETAVGAKWSAAIRVVSTRLASSGQGACKFQVRRPASTWPNGMR